jgi:hypothetical protein
VIAVDRRPNGTEWRRWRGWLRSRSGQGKQSPTAVISAICSFQEPRESSIGCTVGTSGRLGLESVPTGHCITPTAEKPWSQLTKIPTEFGLDMFSVQGASHVLVTAVELIDPVGIRLEDVAFVAGGAVGDGADFGESRAATFPKMWTSRRQLPSADLTTLTGSDAPSAGTWSGFARWQVVVGIVATQQGGGQSAGVRITYQTRGQVRHFVGQAAVAIKRTFDECDKVTAIP